MNASQCRRVILTIKALSGYLSGMRMMQKIRPFIICLAFSLIGINRCCSQNTDTLKPKKENDTHPYFVISAGTEINAFFNDRPVSVSSIEDFNDYIQHNIKSLKDSWVVVTGKPNSGTYNDVLKTLSRYHFKHISKNIIKD
jgi:hypothetical protein